MPLHSVLSCLRAALIDEVITGSSGKLAAIPALEEIWQAFVFE